MGNLRENRSPFWGQAHFGTTDKRPTRKETNRWQRDAQCAPGVALRVK